MRNQQKRLPIILILVVLLSASSWVVASASTRVSASLHGAIQIGGGHHATTLSGEPDTPGTRAPGIGGIGGNRRLIVGSSDGTTAGIWIRLLQVRIFGQ